MMFLSIPGVFCRRHLVGYFTEGKHFFYVFAAPVVLQVLLPFVFFFNLLSF
jgi:hypothetical protein